MKEQPTVLFVDDEPALADGQAARVSDTYETLTAYGGRSALGILEETDVDVVFLDRRMPGMSGEEILEAIREAEYGCGVVMLTGVEPKVDIVEMGYDEYLLKPISEEALRETLESLLAGTTSEVDDEILDTLGDPKTRRCWYELVEDAMSAQELADATGFSLTTVYRRLNALQQADVIVARQTVDASGDHFKTFQAVPTRIHLEIGDTVRLDVERPDEQHV